MTPEQISLVVRRWTSLGRRREVLGWAVATHLRGTDPMGRAAWLIQAVDRLHPLLETPARFALVAGDLVGRRAPVTADELAADRDALLAGLEDVAGPLSEEETAAWRQACDLVAECLTALALAPFDPPPATGHVAGDTPRSLP